MPSIIVTGGARGIGKAIAVRLAQDAKAKGAAAQFVLADRLADDLKSTAQELRAAGHEVVTVDGDLAEPEYCERVVAAAEKAYKGVDILISNAGMYMEGPMKDLPLASWDRVIDVNTRATWLLAKAAYPLLKQSKGQIVVTSSISGLNPQPWLGAYSVSKAAVKMLAEQLAIEWGGDGIRTNVISPGMIRTPNVEHVYSDPIAKARREKFAPVGRISSPEEVAGVVSFLVGPDAAYLNGANIVIDGGLTRGLMLQMAHVAKT